jgi:hypothetical protein
MSTTTNNNSNQIRAAVLLKYASENLNASIANCHILIDSIINLLHGSNTAKELIRHQIIEWQIYLKEFVQCRYQIRVGFLTLQLLFSLSFLTQKITQTQVQQ